jgi:hypothetical protein
MAIILSEYGGQGIGADGCLYRCLSPLVDRFHVRWTVTNTLTLPEFIEDWLVFRLVNSDRRVQLNIVGLVG